MEDLVIARVLDAWGVPKEAWRTLVEREGATEIWEIYEALHVLMPDGMADLWMRRPNDNVLFDGHPPMKKLLEPGGLVEIRNLVMGRLNVW